MDECLCEKRSRLSIAWPSDHFWFWEIGDGGSETRKIEQYREHIGEK